MDVATAPGLRPTTVGRLPVRIAFILPAVACAALLATGYYLQYFAGQEPCPLCLVQRGFYYATGAIALAAALHAPGPVGVRVYAALGALFALGGAAVAARQVWLQHLPPERVPACGPDLYFMLQNFPLARTIEKLFTGSGQCAEVDWTFLGLSIAEWSLGCFAALAAYSAWVALRAR